MLVATPDVVLEHPLDRLHVGGARIRADVVDVVRHLERILAEAAPEGAAIDVVLTNPAVALHQLTDHAVDGGHLLVVAEAHPIPAADRLCSIRDRDDAECETRGQRDPGASIPHHFLAFSAWYAIGRLSCAKMKHSMAPAPADFDPFARETVEDPYPFY